MDREKLCSVWRAKGYQVSVFETVHEAARHLDQSINGCTVGFGDSQTLQSMRLCEMLSQHNRVFNPDDCDNTAVFLEIARHCLTADVFITSVNAAAETGELVNIDGTGNRIAGSLFGHRKVYFVVGKNKIVPTLEQAVDRARNVAAPRNAQRLGRRTPCAQKADRCYDCASPERICNGMMVQYSKMNDIQMEIVLIEAELGL